MKCPQCDSEFVPTSHHVHRFCSRQCKDRFSDARDRIEAQIDNGPVATLRDVADALGMSKSRVDQIEKQALAKLRRVMDRSDYR